MLKSSIASLPLLSRGKVRDNYAVGDDRMLMVASDRWSAFDVVTGEPIPGKDEVLRPDSSRFWPVEGYREGANPPSYDKQFVRDWLEHARVDGKPWNKKAPAPALPAEVIAQTAAKYREALARLSS